MKIGILTFHHTTNYGATLQAYALYKTIASQGHDVEIIDYRPDKAARYYRQKVFPFTIKNRRIHPKKYALKELVKYLKTRVFLLAKIRLSRKTTSKKEDLKINYDRCYDMVICGSDQIWCLDNRFRGFDTSYFLDFISDRSACRKISYAASFGMTKNLGENQKIITQLISQFDAISVRDLNSLRLIQQECNEQAIRVLDPTFLTNYSEILSETNLRVDYLLIYNTKRLEVEEENFIRAIAKSNKLTIVSVGTYNKLADINLIGVGPTEWLGYFKNSSYIITNSYHGVIFSLIFKKQFFVLCDKSKMQKNADLLQQLDLEDRVLDSKKLSNLPKNPLNVIDYEAVDRKLEQEISKSKNYLIDVLDSKQNQLTHTKV